MGDDLLDVSFIENETTEYEESKIDVEFIVAIPESDDEAYLLSKRGWDADLLESQYLVTDCGLIIPENITAGVYKCTNLRVTNYYESDRGWENEHISYDLECDWEKLIGYFEEQNNEK
jgi:hypothetical protein